MTTTTEGVAAIIFAVAVLHTFAVRRFETWAHRLPDGSPKRNVLELLGEVETVFGLWAGVFLVALAALTSGADVIVLLEGDMPGRRIDFTEPAFVFAIMTMAATRPVIGIATQAVEAVSRRLPVAPTISFLATTLVLGPMLGSLITGPAAMTVTALILKQRFYDRGISDRLAYATIATLFVNVSIGGTMTNFAAPPVLMVARPWGWDVAFMAGNFGYKALLAVIVNASLLAWWARGELAALPAPAPTARARLAVPPWLVVVHLALLAGVVYNAHHMVVFLGVFLLFLGVVEVTDEFQDELKLREALLVSFFLGGLVVLGSFQRWWLQPLIGGLDAFPLFLGAAALTAVTDNAALTYLGSLVEGITAADRYALVAGAVAGGGLTVIANAPNPAGYGILKDSFGPDGISPVRLLVAATRPTMIALLALWLLPSLTS